MVQRLQERMPPCPALEHKRADISKARSYGWYYDEGLVDGYSFAGLSKLFTIGGVEEIVLVTVALEDFTMWEEYWKKGEIIGAQAREVAPILTCAEWPVAVMEQVKAEVLAVPALPIPPWAIAAILGGVAVVGLALAYQAPKR